MANPIIQTLAEITAQISDLELRRLAQDVYDRAERGADAHTKTGALKQSLFLRPISKGWEIGHNLQHARHAIFVHWGTRPHIIERKNRLSLRWETRFPGTYAYAKRVHHPGYRGDPWLTRATTDAIAAFRARTGL